MTPYLLRTVRIGLHATWLAIVALVVYPFVPGADMHSATAYWATTAAAAGGGLVVRLLPWKRLFEAGVGFRFLYAWSMGDIVLISLLVAATGGASSPMTAIYALTTLFFAMSYPERGRLFLLLFTFAAYGASLALGPAPIDYAWAGFEVAILTVVAFLSSFLANEMRLQMTAHSDAREESERRAHLLGTVARAARSMSTLDSENILETVVDSVVSMGFEAANLCDLEEGSLWYSVQYPRGIPESFAEARHRTDRGMVALVLDQGGTVVVDDYRTYDRGFPEIQEQGFRAVIATPVWTQARMAAVLVGGTRQTRTIASEDVEAFELLASQAGRALENAHLFEEERRTVQRLEDLDRLKQEFIDMVSHELRTPLTAIHGMGLTLERRWGELDESTRLDLLIRLNGNSQTLEEIITTLLDFSRLDGDPDAISVSAVDCSGLLQGVAERLDPLLGNRKVLLEAEDGLEVLADPVLLERVVENLVGNAAKHTPEGTEVTLAAIRSAGEVEIRVSDNGPGIRPTDLPHLGERFFRGGHPNDRPVRGTGLGLALVRKILSLHDSDLSISSTLGEGADFSFRLRAAGKPTSSAAAAGAMESA